jgi:hypothetical protein
LGGGNVNKIPGAGGGVGSVTRAQFIAPFQKIGQALDAQLQPLRGFAGAVGLPGNGGVFAGEPAKIVPQFNSQQRIPQNSVARSRLHAVTAGANSSAGLNQAISAEVSA